MPLKSRKLTAVTGTDGAGVATDTSSLLGKLYAVQWIDGSFADGVDAVLSSINNEAEVDITLLTLTDANADAFYYPRVVQHSEAGVALTGTAGGDRTPPVINGTLKLVIAQGGDTKTGSCVIYYED